MLVELQHGVGLGQRLKDARLLHVLAPAGSGRGGVM